MIKDYGIWEAYLKYGSIMRVVLLDDHLKEIATMRRQVEEVSKECGKQKTEAGYPTITPKTEGEVNHD